MKFDVLTLFPEMFDVLADAENSGIVVSAATLDELAGLEGMNRLAAENLFEFFHRYEG